jgi:hypothetical protein
VLVPFVVRHVLRKPDLIAEMLLCYTLPALFSVPLWMWLGERFDKRTLWMRAMALSGIGFGLLLFLGEGTIGLMIAASLVAGAASRGCAPTLGQALKADVIDRDELATGERKEGAYFAAWSFVSKIASGIMIGLAGFALDLSGFVAGVEEQGRAAVNAMLFLSGGMPLLGFAAGMWLFRGFGLTQEEHARVLAGSPKATSAVRQFADTRRGRISLIDPRSGVREIVHLGGLRVQGSRSRARAFDRHHPAIGRRRRGPHASSRSCPARRARAAQVHHQILAGTRSSPTRMPAAAARGSSSPRAARELDIARSPVHANHLLSVPWISTIARGETLRVSGAYSVDVLRDQCVHGTRRSEPASAR